MSDKRREELFEACLKGDFKKVKKYIKKYKVRIPEVKGKMEQIVVGTKVIKTEQLNILHLAVYQGRMDLLKLICE